MSDHYAVRNLLYPKTKVNQRSRSRASTKTSTAPTPPSIQNKDIEGDPSGPLDEPAKEDEWVEDENGNFVRPRRLKPKY